MADIQGEAKETGFRGYLCCRCNLPVSFAEKAKKCLCSICGVVNVMPEFDPNAQWLGCIVPDKHEWNMTSGVIGDDVPMKPGAGGKMYIDYDALIALPMDAKVMFTTAEGARKSRADWIRERGCDPASELKRMRARMHPVAVNVIP